MAISRPGVSAFPVNLGGITGTVSPLTLGDLMIVGGRLATATVAPTSVSGGGVDTWSSPQAGTFIDITDTQTVWFAYGVVTSTAASQTLTVTLNGATPTNETYVDSLHSDAGGNWILDSKAALSTAAGTTVSFPSLTAPIASNFLNEAYWGYAWGSTTAAAGTSTGFTYTVTVGNNMVLFNGAIAPGSATAPTSKLGTTGAAYAVGVLFRCMSTPTYIPRPMPLV